MRPIDVLFLIEHVDRELDAASCIVEILERKYGLRAEVRNFYADMLYCLRRNRPTVIVTPFFYFLDHHPMKDYAAAWPQAAFVNMAWEQILYKMNQSVKVPKDDFAKTRVTHVCWTRAYQDFLNGLGVDTKRLALAGNPVMKFYDEPYRHYFTSRRMLSKRHGLDASRKWVLFPENYRWAFLTDGQIRAFVKQDADPKFLAEARDYCQRSFATLFQWLQDLDRQDDPIVIIRPRPATAKSQIGDFMRKSGARPSSSVRVIKSESAREWILAADHVVTSYSTTLIESALARKPIHVFSPEPLPEALSDDWYAHAPTLTTREALLAAFRDRQPADTWRRLDAWARESLLPAGDPLETIAKVIAVAHDESAGAARRCSRSPDRLRAMYGQWLVEKSRKVLQRQARYHNVLRKRDARYAFTLDKHEKDIFGADDVQRRVNRWKRRLKDASHSLADGAHG